MAKIGGVAKTYDLGINRNIMEFKDPYLFNCFTAIIELIET